MGSGYCTINVNVTDCVELPEVAVTITWDVPMFPRECQLVLLRNFRRRKPRPQSR